MKKGFLIAASLLCWGIIASAEESKEEPSAAPAAPAETAEEAVFPVAPGPARYAALVDRSPFAPATPVVEEEAPPPPPPPFSGDYYITGIAKIGDQPFVTIFSRTKQERFFLEPGSTYGDITLARVEWSDELGKSRAVLVRNGEEGVVSFDEAVMKAPPIPQPTPVAVTPPQPTEGHSNEQFGRRGRGGWGRGGGGGGGGYWGRRNQQIPGPR